MQRINSADKRRLRSWLCDKHGGRCCYCGKTVGGAGTVDHYLPQALGGTNAKPNLRWACLLLTLGMHPRLTVTTRAGVL